MSESQGLLPNTPGSELDPATLASSSAPTAAVGIAVEEGATGPVASRWRSLLSPKFLFALFDQGIVSFGNMVIAASVARHSPAAAFGLFILALRSIDVINQLSSVLIWGPFIFNLPGLSASRQKQFLGSVLMHQITAALVGIVVVYGLGLFSVHRGDTTYAQLFLPLALPTAAIVFREFVRRIYFAHMRFQHALVTDGITVGLQIAALWALIHFGRLSLPNALWALSVPCAVMVLYWVATEWRTITFSLKAYRSDFKLNLELGRWFFGSNMVLLASAQVSPWVLSATTGPIAVAAFAVCESVVNIPRVALTSMQNMMGPMMARDYAAGGKAALHKVVRRMEWLIISGSIFFAAVIMIFGPWISRAIFHTSPANAREILVLLALNLIAYGAALATSYGLSAMNLAKLNFHPQAIGLVIQVAVVALTVERLGVVGVALGLFLGSIVVLILRARYYHREVARV